MGGGVGGVCVLCGLDVRWFVLLVADLRGVFLIFFMVWCV